MKKKYYIATIFIISFFFSFIFASENIKQIRVHYKLDIKEGSQIEYTNIYKYDIENKSKVNEEITLIELQDGERIIVHQKTKYKDNKFKNSIESPEISEYTLKLLDSKEVLKVIIKYDKKVDFKVNEYEVVNAENNEKIKIVEKEIPKNPSHYIPFIKENFSEKFISALEKLRQISFLCFNEQKGFPVSVILFKPIWGKIVEDKNNHRGNNLKLEIVDTNCSFDAQFGYPCQPEEVPAKNPKILIIEK